MTHDLRTYALRTLEVCYTIAAQVIICTSDLVRISLKLVNHISLYAASCLCTVDAYAKLSVTKYVKGNTAHLLASQLHGLVHTCATIATHTHIQSETM